MMGRIWHHGVIVALTALLLVGLTHVGKAGNERRTARRKGAFSAFGPVPYTGWGVDTYGCYHGPEGVSKTTANLKVPFTGYLHVVMSGFVGEWDLYVLDQYGENIAESAYFQGVRPPVETLTMKVKAGSQIAIVPCNFAGGATAEVAWSLVAPGPGRTDRYSGAWYTTSAGGCSAVHPQLEDTWFGYGCVWVTGRGGERFVQITANDASGLPVYGKVSVDGNGDNRRKPLGDFCGATDEPLDVSLVKEVSRFAAYDVYIHFVAPPNDVECARATAGKLEVMFSNRP